MSGVVSWQEERCEKDKTTAISHQLLNQCQQADSEWCYRELLPSGVLSNGEETQVSEYLRALELYRQNRSGQASPEKSNGYSEQNAVTTSSTTEQHNTPNCFQNSRETESTNQSARATQENATQYFSTSNSLMGYTQLYNIPRDMKELDCKNYGKDQLERNHSPESTYYHQAPHHFVPGTDTLRCIEQEHENQSTKETPTSDAHNVLHPECSMTDSASESHSAQKLCDGFQPMTENALSGSESPDTSLNKNFTKLEPSNIFVANNMSINILPTPPPTPPKASPGSSTLQQEHEGTKPKFQQHEKKGDVSPGQLTSKNQTQKQEPQGNKAKSQLQNPEQFQQQESQLPYVPTQLQSPPVLQGMQQDHTIPEKEHELSVREKIPSDVRTDPQAAVKPTAPVNPLEQFSVDTILMSLLSEPLPYESCSFLRPTYELCVETQAKIEAKKELATNKDFDENVVEIEEEVEKQDQKVVEDVPVQPIIIPDPGQPIILPDSVQPIIVPDLAPPTMVSDPVRPIILKAEVPQMTPPKTTIKRGRPKGSRNSKPRTENKRTKKHKRDFVDDDDFYEDYSSDSEDYTEVVRKIEAACTKGRTTMNSKKCNAKDNHGASTSKDERNSFFDESAMTSESDYAETLESSRRKKYHKTAATSSKTNLENDETPIESDLKILKPIKHIQTKRNNRNVHPPAKKNRNDIPMKDYKKISDKVIHSLFNQVLTPAKSERSQFSENFESPIIRRAIYNQSSHCYAISAVQLALRVPQIYSMIRRHSHKKKKTRSECTSCKLGELMSTVPQREDFPVFIDILQTKWLNMEAQEMHCVMETMEYLFDFLDKEYMENLSRCGRRNSKSSTPLRKMFSIQQIDKSKCKACLRESTQTNTFLHITVETKRKFDGTMQDSIDCLSRESGWRDDHCLQCSHLLYSTLSFVKLPKVLLYFVPRAQPRRKKDLTVITIQDQIVVKDRKREHTYLLCAFVAHYGPRGNSGHYKTFEVDRSEGVQYIEYDDGKVTYRTFGKQPKDAFQVTMNSALPNDIHVVLALFRREDAVAKDAHTDMIFNGNGNMTFAHEKYCEKD
ncbi:hypothetical protein CRE_07481 [Caenorhabditis remanei]|uniref:USP domain-containing protein n=1 Tax=Caenorhabditis remanei TaxID=31234 RepID=E3M2S8_CAERE|nr:hypothetical protein CRE_07481 [Caenorhabditis remanei]